ncbi:hypothetical protein ACFS27_09800 [Promicromonospora vindobonensis]|uniref:Uncharacterized protein n=1 Tax=Promicromonospora vindobonensis TaxID=195748 RepID=A0ABW5VTN7_9MICO
MRGGNRYIGWATGLEPVPMRDSAQGAPGKARNDQREIKAAEPLPVWVWLVLSNRGDYRAKAEALAWTEAQVWVRFIDPIGREGFVWVWANAVQRR